MAVQLKYGQPRDVVIFSAGFGLGHQSAALALNESVRQNMPGVSVATVDLLELLAPLVHKPLYGSYYFMVNHAAGMYNYFWERKEEDQDLMTSRVITRWLMPALVRYMAEVRPRLVISTFPLCSYYLSRCKSSCGADFRLVTCITDILSRREWLHQGTDLYLVPSPDIKLEMIANGWPEEIIEVSGIPVRSAFRPPGRTALLNQAPPPALDNIREDDFVILFMGGSLGRIPAEPDLYRWLASLRHTSCLLVTAHNQRLREHLERCRLGPAIRILGFEPDTASLMQRADLLITSAGGVTVFEALASELPMLIYQPRLGQEVANARFVENCGLGRICHRIEELKSQILCFTNNKALAARHRTAIRSFNLNVHQERIGQRIADLMDEPGRQPEDINHIICLDNRESMERMEYLP